MTKLVTVVINYNEEIVKINASEGSHQHALSEVAMVAEGLCYF